MDINKNMDANLTEETKAVYETESPKKVSQKAMTGYVRLEGETVH